MNAPEEKSYTQMFAMRVWAEEVENGRFEIRGTLKHVLSGETHHFRDLAALNQLIEHAVKPKEAQVPGGI